MDKPAPTDYPVHELIQNRWSPRAFDPRPLETDTLLSILEAARWAPSSNNLQPWRFIVANRDNEVNFQQMLSVLVEGNRSWAQQAGALLLVCAEVEFERDGATRSNRHAWHDAGIAVAHIALQALDLGVYVHMMGGYDREAAREVFSIPANVEPVTAIALGYPGNPDDLPERVREREFNVRMRNPLATQVYESTFGQTAAFIPSTPKA